MSKIISLFNHKGGVSKTTTTFNLGWALSDIGEKVLIVDADPQCNLTGTVLGFDSYDELEDFYKMKDNTDLYNYIKPVLQGETFDIPSSHITKTKNENLYLLAGHINLGNVESTLSVSLKTSKALPVLQNLPGYLTKLIREISQRNEIDIVLIDMSPSSSALNECLLMGSDFFIVPTSPDFYCNQAVYSLSEILSNWNEEVDQFRNSGLKNRLPKNPPKFLGILSQKYRPRSRLPAKSFQKWIDKIKETTKETLVKKLMAINMSITEQKFIECCKEDTPYNLANIPDFNYFIAISQSHQTPVFALSIDQMKENGMRGGKVIENMEENRNEFQNKFNALAESVIKLIE